MEIKTIKIIYLILAVFLVLLSLSYSFLLSFQVELNKNFNELTIINTKLKETKDNLNEILSETSKLNTFNKTQAKEKLLEYVDKLAQKYNLEIKETPKVDENSRTVSMVITLSGLITTKKQLEELLSYTTNEDIFFLIKDLEIYFSQNKGYSINLTVELKNAFIQH